METVARGLEVPWALAFAGRDVLLVTERPGRVRVVVRGRLRRDPALTLAVANVGEAGLLGIAVDPRFPARRFVYLYYTLPTGNRLVRFRLTRDLHLRDPTPLLVGVPAGFMHDGGRIGFGPDRLLYVTTGETGNPLLAADRLSLAGKILRVRPDGGVPAGNPFHSPVYTYGHRNPQGIAWDREGRLYESEHGPTGEGGLCCHDELNRIERGRFYGWPYVAGRSRTGAGTPRASRSVPPLAESGRDTWAPSGLAVDEPRNRPASLFVAALRGERLLRFPLRRGRVTGPPTTALSGYGRLRAVVIGPDRCLYVTTSNRDGRETPREGDDRILRVCRHGSSRRGGR